jgi:hypothetical protein
MSRKIVALVAVAAVALFTVVDFSLNSIIRKNRARIQQDMERAIGRAVTFSELNVSFWGGPGIAAADLKVADDARFAATPIVQAKKLRMQLRWLPLALGRLRIEKFILEEPEIQIIRNEAGLLNLAVLVTREKKSAAPAAAEAAKDKRSAGAPRLAITDFRIRNGSIDYIDRSPRVPVEVRVRRLDLTASGTLNAASRVKVSGEIFEDGRVFTIEGQAGPFSGRPWTQVPLDVSVRCDALGVDQLARAVPPLRAVLLRYLPTSGPVTIASRVAGTIERPRISGLDLRGPFFGATANNATVVGDIDLSRGASWEEGEIKLRATIDPLALEQLKAVPAISEALPGPLLAQGPVSLSADIDGTPAALNIRAAGRATRSEIVYGDWFKKNKDVPAELSIDLQRNKDRVVLRDAILAVNNAKLRFSGVLDEQPDRQLTLTIGAENLPLADVDGLAPPLALYALGGGLSARLALKTNLGGNFALDIRGGVTIDKALIKERRSGRGIERATGQIVFRGKDARIDQLLLRAGDSDISVAGAVADIMRPVLRYSLRSRKIDPGDLASQTAFKRDQLRAVASTGELGFQNGKPWLRANIASGEGTLADIPYRNLRAEIVWSPQSLAFKNVLLQALGGTVRGGGSWETADDNSLRIGLEPNIDSADLRGLSKGPLSAVAEYVDGRLSLKGKFRAAGKNVSSLPQGLAGAGEAQLRGGVLKDINLPRLVLTQLGLRGAPRRMAPRIAALAEGKNMPFESLAGNFTLQDGRAYSKNLLVSAADYTASAEGHVDLDKSLEWDGVLTFSAEFAQDLARELPDVAAMVDAKGRLAVPFKLRGSLGHAQATTAPPQKAEAPAR